MQISQIDFTISTSILDHKKNGTKHSVTII